MRRYYTRQKHSSRINIFSYVHIEKVQIVSHYLFVTYLDVYVCTEHTNKAKAEKWCVSLSVYAFFFFHSKWSLLNPVKNIMNMTLYIALRLYIASTLYIIHICVCISISVDMTYALCVAMQFVMLVSARIFAQATQKCASKTSTECKKTLLSNTWFSLIVFFCVSVNKWNAFKIDTISFLFVM